MKSYCDVCGDGTYGELDVLKPEYSPDGVVQLCYECRGRINERIRIRQHENEREWLAVVRRTVQEVINEIKEGTRP